MNRDVILEYVKANKGKIVGVLLGMTFGILVLTINFWRALFLAICVFIGYYIGRKFDGDRSFRSFVDRILPGDYK